MQEALDIAIKHLSYKELLTRLRDPRLLLVNVLPREAFAQGYIPGSLNLPLPELEERVEQVLPNRKSDLVVYCGSPS